MPAQLAQWLDGSSSDLVRSRLRGWLRRRLARDFDTAREPLRSWLADDPPQRLAWLGEIAWRPTISVLVPVCDPDPVVLGRCLDSVSAQVYRRLELCIADDASREPAVARLLRERAARDRRVRLCFATRREGGAAASNRALALARGAFCGVLDHDDELHPEALLELVRALNRQPRADLIYTDEDKIDVDGRHFDPWLKSDWNPDLALSFHYVMHFALYRRALLEELGGFRREHEGSHDYDLLLRVAERSHAIHHVPRVLYHWRAGERSIATAPDAKPYVFESGIAALRDALRRRDIDGTAQHAPDAWPGVYCVRRRILDSPRVSCVIASRGDATGLARTLASLRGQKPLAPAEILVCGVGAHEEVGGGSELRGDARWIAGRAGDTLPRRLDAAAREATGELLLFLDDRVELLDAETIAALVEQAQRPEVGAAGGKLFYEDGRIEHAGVIGGPFGLFGYAHRNTPDDGGYVGLKRMIGNYAAVLGLGMLTRRASFAAVGGFDPHYVDTCWDVDYCLRLGEEGLAITYTPFARLRHHIPVQGTHDLATAPDAARFRARWQHWIDRDPFFAPGLSREREDFFPLVDPPAPS